MFGLIKENMKDNGIIIKCMVLVLLNGQMEKYMMESNKQEIIIYRYLNDKKDGFGTFIWPDGRKYVG